MSDLRSLGPLHIMRNCVCFAKEFCQHEAILSANSLFYLPKFSEVSPNFNDAVE